MRQIYPSYWDSKITIFHKDTTIDDRGKKIPKWRAKIFTGCFVKSAKSSVMTNETEEHSQFTIIRIPCERCTISLGDVVVVGEHDTNCDDITVASDIKKKHPSALVINELRDNTLQPLLKHIYLKGV